MYTVVPNGSQIIISVYLLIQLHEIILKTFDSGQKLLINDCRGIPKGVTEKDIYEKDLKSIINGHIKKNYEVFFSYFFSKYKCNFKNRCRSSFQRHFFPNVLKENCYDLR